MSQAKSLSDSAVEALASVSRMDWGVTNEDDHRHQVRTLKRLAEQAMADAFRHAIELAWLAEDICRSEKEKSNG
jgi:hypothetical protein